MTDDSRGEAIKRGLDAQDYVDSKREFESDRQQLAELKLRRALIGEPTAQPVVTKPATVAEPMPLASLDEKASGSSRIATSFGAGTV